MKWITNFFKKIAKKKTFWVLLVVVAIILIYIFSRGGEKTEYITEKIVKGTLTQTVSETGSIQAASEIDLNFKGNGTITEINVKEGDEVKEGDLLARLDAGNLEIQVRQSQATLDIAQANLNRFLAGASVEDIKVSEESVNNAWIAYENAKTDRDALVVKIEADIKNFEEAVKIIETNLNDITNTVDQLILDSRQNLFTTIDSSLAAADHALDSIKVVLDDIDLNNDFNNKYSVLNIQYKNDSQNYYAQGLERVDEARNVINTAKASLKDIDIDLAIDKSKESMEVVRNATAATFLALSNSITDFKFNQAKLDAYKLNIKAEQSTIDGMISSLNVAIQNYDGSNLNRQTQLNTAQGAYDTAKNNLAIALSSKELQIAQSEAQVDSALGSYNLAKAQLDFKKAPPRQVDTAYYQAQVNQAKAALDLALSNLDDYIIYAPTDGIVVFVNNIVGEQIGFGITNITEAARPVITMLGKGEFEIEVDIPESDIIKVKVGNKAKITLDAFGDEVVFEGKVVFVDLAETNIQDVVYYKVTVGMEKTDQEIKNGMTANVDILTKEKEGVLIAPARSLKEDENGNKYVEVLRLGNPKKIEVTEGFRGDQGIEIISGLEEGAEVITYKKEVK